MLLKLNMDMMVCLAFFYLAASAVDDELLGKNQTLHRVRSARGYSSNTRNIMRREHSSAMNVMVQDLRYRIHQCDECDLRNE